MGKGSKILRFMLFEITHLVHFYCFFMLKFFFSLEYGANNGKDNFINHYNKINTNKKYFALSVSSDPLQYPSQTFLAPETGFVEEVFLWMWARNGGWFGDDSSPFHLLCTLFLLFHQLHQIIRY